ncbi:MAG: 4Fe-4S binding protein [Bacteroidales bacterium]|nr:4Fe-4S binding protein [Bacteroidales bacterium]
MLRIIRRIFASIFLIGITLLFLDFTGIISSYFSWMAKVQFLPAVMSANLIVIAILIVSTLVLGRVYCSVICPMGIMQDVISHWSGRIKKNRFSYSNEKRILRIVVLCIFIVMILCGIGSAVALLAPYSAYGRIVTNIVQPGYIAINNMLADWAEANNSFAFYRTDLWIKSVSALAVSIVTLITIGLLAWRHGRTYCNTICPVGTVLGYVAKFSFLKPIIDTSKCVNCGLCSKNCKASCINVKEHTIDYSRCVSCFNCIDKCNKHAISYRHAPKQKASIKTVTQEKRNFLSMLGIMATSAIASAQEKTVDGGLAPIIDKKVIKRETPIVPAGSQSLRNFYQKCTGCQLCVSKCPNGVLRPSSELTNLLQPVMSYERGFCRPECTRCSQVCPAGAITPITRVEKSSIKIGTAVWNKELCLPLAEGVECGNCARKCPVGAIRMIPSDANDSESIRIPMVDSERCIGCGACENLCPVRPISAIHVEGIEVHRFN